MKIIVIDYSTSEVHVYPFNESGDTACEDCLSEHGHRESDCEWMIVDELKLTIH
jgi:hypothetical protein